MSQIFKIDTSTILADVETISDNFGTKVGPDGVGNVSFVGAGGVVVTGTPGSNLLTITDSGTDQDQIIYVGKHGNDANDGLTIEKAKLTFQAAINAAGFDYTIVCFDDGNYAENLTFAAATHVFAPNARLTGSHILWHENYICFTGIIVPTGGTGFTFNTAGNTSYIQARSFLSCEGTGTGILCSNGTVHLNTKTIEIANGSLIGGATDSDISVTFEKIVVSGSGSIFSCVDGAHINAIGNSIYNEGVGDGLLFETSGGGAPEISATISSVNLERMSDITAGSIVKLNVGDMNGSMAEAGAGKVTVGGATRIDNVPIGDVTPSNATFTTLVANTSLQVTALGVGVTQTDATGLVSTSTGTDGQVLVANTAGTAPVWANLTAGTDISITDGSGSITINSTCTAGIPWQIITADLNPIVPGNGYICNKAGLLSLTLPTTAAVGTVLRVTGMNTDLGWTIAQSANQTIHIGDVSTTVGAGGSLASTLKRDSVDLVCVVEDLEWNITSAVGNISVV